MLRWHRPARAAPRDLTGEGPLKWRGRELIVCAPKNDRARLHYRVKYYIMAFFYMLLSCCDVFVMCITACTCECSYVWTCPCTCYISDAHIYCQNAIGRLVANMSIGTQLFTSLQQPLESNNR